MLRTNAHLLIKKKVIVQCVCFLFMWNNEKRMPNDAEFPFSILFGAQGLFKETFSSDELRFYTIRKTTTASSNLLLFI